jgi:6-pyruvoyltetrahydropterin/6-carboxytetrahydropterin synthase
VVQLTRAVRFAVNAPGLAPDGAGSQADGAPSAGAHKANGYAAAPALLGLGAFYELLITARGEPDARTGYFLDIKHIDRAARQTVLPAITRAVHAHWQARAGEPALGVHAHDVLAGTMTALNGALGGVLVRARWCLSPFFSVEVGMDGTGTGAGVQGFAVMRQRFEIAAAHRLYVPGLSDEANRAVFGKCNHVSGHGHNYVIEPAVRVPVGAGAHDGAPFSVRDLERLVDERILQPFDHTHLNLDAPAFMQERGGVNPSVENISRVFFELLAPAVASAPGGASLASVTVYETEKTSSTYPG